MNKTQNLTFSGIALLLAGVAMLAFESIGVSTTKILIPILFITSGVFSIMFSNANPQTKGPSQYHMIHGIGLVLFGIIFGVVPKSLGDFLTYATYFILFFGFLEIIISFALLNSGSKLEWRTVIERFFGGFLGTIGAVLILVTSATDEISGLVITGVATVLIGIGIIVFSKKINNISM